MGLLSTTHIHRHEVAPAYPQTIHEHRAPTDQSIGLLTEMEEKVLARVVERVSIASESAGIYGEAMVLDYAESCNAYVLALSVRINGKPHTRRRLVHEGQLRSRTQGAARELIDGEIKSMLTEIVVEVLTDLIRR